jgi:hypothetical protein
MDQITFDYVMVYGFTFVVTTAFAVWVIVTDGRRR